MSLSSTKKIFSLVSFSFEFLPYPLTPDVHIKILLYKDCNAQWYRTYEKLAKLFTHF